VYSIVKKSTFSILLSICAILTVSAWALWSLRIPGLYTSHDGTIHVGRIIEFDRALKDGQFPPRWGKNFNEGLGSPVLILNYQLPYFIATGIHQFGFSYINSYKLTIALAYVLSGLTALYVFTKIFGYVSGLAGAMMYLFTPYHFLDVYVRSAFGEIISFIFVPLILLAVRKRSLLLGTLGFAGLFLSHPVGSALFSLLFLGYTILLSLVRQSRSYVISFFLMFFLAFGIASFNILPALFETRYTEYSPSNSDPLKHFPTIKQLIYHPWGFGFSTIDANDGMSFQIGIGQWVVVISALVIMLGNMLRKIARTKSENLKEKGDILAIYMVSAFMFSIFFMLSVSTPIWSKLRLDKIIDFPWRILMVPAFITPYLGAWLVSKMYKQTQLFMAIFLILLVMYANRNHIRINAILPLDENYFLQNVGTGDSWGEYTSLFRHTHEGKRFDRRMEILEGDGNLQIEKDTTTTIQAAIRANEKVKIRINAAYYPGWMVWFNDVNIPINGGVCHVTDPPLQRELSGLIECTVPPDVTNIRAEYTVTPPQQAGNVVSLFSFGVFLWIVYRLSSQHTMKKEIFLR